MAVLKLFLTVVGLLLVLFGLLWAGQGSGLFPYPATSPMINQPQWVFAGLVVAGAGIAILYISRRMTGR